MGSIIVREPLEVPEIYSGDVRAFVEGYLTDGKIAVCTMCRKDLQRVRRPGEIAQAFWMHVIGPQRSAPGDLGGAMLFGSILEFAWMHNRGGRPFARPTANLAAALEIIDAHPMAPLLDGEEPGILNMVTRAIEHGVHVTLATHPNGDLYVIDFHSLDRERGNGRRGMERLCAVADRHGVALTGLVEAHANKGGEGRTMSVEELLSWYATFGFERIGEEEGRPRVRRRAQRPLS
jgi:hypothetical protein